MINNPKKLFSGSLRYSDIKEIARVIKDRESLTIVHLNNKSFSQILQGVAEKTYLKDFIHVDELKKKIVLYYNFRYGEEYFKPVLEASLSRYTKQSELLKQYFDLMEKGFHITLISQNFKFEYKETGILINLLSDLDRKKTKFIVSMQASEYFSEKLTRHDKTNIISHNLLFIKLLDKEEIFEFIDSIAKDLNLNVSLVAKKIIAEFSLGFPSIIKNCLREYKSYKNITKALNSNEMKNIVNITWNSFSERERIFIKKYILGKSIKNYKNEKEYFETFRLDLVKLKKVSRNWLQLVQIPKVENKLILKKKRIFRNEIDITDEFSSLERSVLTRMLSDKSNEILRDEIVRLKSGSKTEISEYAIDKFMSRLRSKLNEQGFKPSLIANLKGRGYKLNNC